MNIKYLFIITFFVFVNSLSGQPTRDYYDKGGAAYEEGNLDLSIQYFDTCVQVGYQQHADLILISKCLHNIGFLLRENNNNYQSIDFFSQAKEIRQNAEKPDTTLLIKSYYNLGESYYEIGDYNTAINYYNKAIKFSIGTNPMLYSNSLHNLGGIYLAKREYERALEYFNTSGKVYDRNDKQLVRTYLNKGYAYDGTEDYNKAIKFYEKALDKCNNSCRELPKIYNNLSISYRKIRNYIKAKEYIRKGDSLNIEESKPGFYNNLGDIFFDENLFDSALIYHEKAVVTEAPEFEGLLKKTPIPHDEIAHSGDKLRVLIYLSSLAHTYYVLGEKQKSHSIYQLCQTEINSILEDVANPESKLGLIQRSNELFDRAINVAYEIDDYRTAFTFSEQRKAVMLMDNLLQIDKQRYSGVPSKLLDNLLYLKKNSSDKTKLYEFENSIKQKYYKYDQVSQQSKRIDIDEIKKNLIGKKSVLIEFFVSDDFIYVFKLDKNGVELERIEKQQLNDDIQKLNEIIANPNMPRTEYINSARNIYKTLLSNVLNGVIGNTQLIIIPDGILYKTPFDALLVSEPTGNFYNLESMEYLIENYSVTYGYSASVLLQNNKSESNNRNQSNRLVAFAPNFTSSGKFCNDTFSLPALKFNIDEAEKVSEYFDGNIYKDISKSALLNQVRQADYVLLSTHAVADVLNESNSKIILKDSCILMNDIQYEQFQAQMVVLSACDTGEGKNEVGEGVLSFARGFAYAGVPSVTMNLWRADDEASSKIIPNYFKYIKKGYSKPEALRKAKLDYIEAEPDTSPYKWASLAHIGNPKPTFNTCNFNLWWLLIVIVLAALFWLLKNRFS